MVLALDNLTKVDMPLNKETETETKQYKQRKNQENNNNKKTKMGRKAIVWTFQATNKRNHTQDELDMAKKKRNLMRQT